MKSADKQLKDNVQKKGTQTGRAERKKASAAVIAVRVLVAALALFLILTAVLPAIG